MSNFLIEEKLEYILPAKAENSILEELDDSYKKISEMSESERQFLNALVLRSKPKKILEVGVAAGASSIVILNAVKNMDSHIYAVDYSENYYRDESLKSGYFVEHYPELKQKYSLYTGGLAGKYLEQIGGEIDFCLIDTMHSNPGEILDFIMVLPYLKEDAIVVFHDTNLHMADLKYNCDWKFTNNILLSAVSGTKLVQGNYNEKEKNLTALPNIAAVRLNKETRAHIFEIFNLLTIKWQYKIADEDEKVILDSLQRFYPEKYTEYFKKVLEHQKNLYLKSVTKILLHFWKKIFSIRNEDGHKVITILNIKFKI